MKMKGLVVGMICAASVVSRKRVLARRNRETSGSARIIAAATKAAASIGESDCHLVRLRNPVASASQRRLARSSRPASNSSSLIGGAKAKR